MDDGAETASEDGGRTSLAGTHDSRGGFVEEEEEVETDDLQRGSHIGRYVVISKLGAGAMGVVFAAYDPKLDRKVAIKLLEYRGGDREAAQVRLQREAQALAKLNHANVVAVHDVGIHAERVFLAMEFIEGKTLGEWMADGEGKRHARPWKEVVAIMSAAGRGLAAAHAVGLVHRDFKPDNVMIGDDGRVRVMDFGLARTNEERGFRGGTTTRSQAYDALNASLTRTGAMMGTPAYMAPEQFEGTEIDARSDQFGFCVVFYEALFGERPFGGETVAELAIAVLDGERRKQPRSLEVPLWLREVVERGLSSAPEERYADMLELLAALAAGGKRRRRGQVSVAALAATLVAGGALGYQRWEGLQREQACADYGATIDELWSIAAQEHARERLGEASERVLPWIDRQVGRWREQATEACERATIEDSWDAERYAQAGWCLDERRLELEVLVAALAEEGEADPGIVEAAAGLSPLSTCLDEAALHGRGEAPTLALRVHLAAVRRELAQARYLERVGRYAEGLDLAARAREQAEGLSWTPQLAAARVREASLLRDLGRYEEAEAVGVQAYGEAARARTWDVASEAAVDLVETVGVHLERHREGQGWAEHAAVVISLASDVSVRREADRVTALAQVLRAAGEPERAKPLFERAVALRERELGDQHPALADSVYDLALTEEALGERAAAKLDFQRALEIWERALGAEHPSVAAARLSLAEPQ
ncbi:serine/threonine protein kinase [Pseudenhygromyxa sp. WMMC2535]|uniref:serine/threonine-protein kinase n=1 Tax=Pseudenhygromyxa sp. WMMC2535 TaxID=2712867 RepID=UPI001556BCB0|nr:serine/threonine-protein kinase [Pseudenhygromyxa sp. WMMC2535]NVB36325.1 serine/threonine protein kinase [Pseudenhygromyxa sp. WMMC2535]